MPSRQLTPPPKVKAEAKTTVPEAPPLPKPEDETTLGNHSIRHAEQLVALLDNGVPVYVLSRISHNHTPQSDFYRIQFLGYARAEGHKWLPIKGESTEWLNTCNCLQVSVDHPSHSIVFGPKSGFHISPELSGLGLSSYAYSKIINWLKDHYPEYAVLPSPVPPPETEGEEARTHRNSRLAAHGFDFEWDDSLEANGHYFKGKARQLISGWDTEKVSEISLTALLTTVSRQDEERIALEHKLHGLQSQERSLEITLQKERQTNLILTGVTCFVLIFGLLRALDLF